MSMRLLKIGVQVTLNGRTCEVVGLTSMSVEPKRVFLRDLETGESFGVEEAALQAAEGTPGRNSPRASVPRHG